MGDAPGPGAVAVTVYMVAADDFWDWEWNEVSPIGRKLLDDVDLETFEGAMLDALSDFQRQSGPIEEIIAIFRQALACFVDVGPLEGNEAAMAETERRFAAFVIKEEMRT